MGKVTSLAMALMLGVSGCAAIYGPYWEPRNRSEADDQDEADEKDGDSDEPGYDEVDPFGTDPDVPDSDEAAASDEGGDATEAGEAKGKQEGGKAKPSGKKGCPGLDERTCKVTVGCAWDSVDKCVTE